MIAINVGNLEVYVTMGRRWRVVAKPPRPGKEACWQLRLRDPDGNWVQRTSGEREEGPARELSASRQTELNWGLVEELEPDEDMPLDEVLARHAEWRQQTGGRQRTIEHCRTVRSKLAQYGLERIDAQILVRLRDRMAASLRSSTINVYLAVAKSAWEWARERGYVTRPWPDLRRLRKQHTEQRPITSEEAALILEGFRGYGRPPGIYYPIVALIHDVGSRVTETCQLQEADLDRTRSTVTFRRTKTRRRTVSVHREVMDLLPVGRPWVFERASGGGPVSRVVVQTAFRKVARLVGLGDEPICLHGFRRAYVTDSLRAGVPLPVSMQLTGHESPGVHLDYQRLAPPDDLRAAADAVRGYRSHTSRTEGGGRVGGQSVDSTTVGTGPDSAYKKHGHGVQVGSGAQLLIPDPQGDSHDEVWWGTGADLRTG